jgi:hypothetical protein
MFFWVLTSVDADVSEKHTIFNFMASRAIQSGSSALKMKTVCSSETVTCTDECTWRKTQKNAP